MFCVFKVVKTNCFTGVTVFTKFSPPDAGLYEFNWFLTRMRIKYGIYKLQNINWFIVITENVLKVKYLHVWWCVARFFYCIHKNPHDIGWRLPLFKIKIIWKWSLFYKFSEISLPKNNHFSSLFICKFKISLSIDWNLPLWPSKRFTSMLLRNKMKHWSDI